MNKIIGLYGRVGTGKSTISQYFVSHQWQYINQDLLGHQVIQEYPQQLVEIFGEGILENDTISRKKLGEIVFYDPIARQRLMEFSYPIIIQKTKDLLQNNPTIIEGAFFYKVYTQIPHTHLLYVDVKTSLLKTRLLQRGHTMSWIDNVLVAQEEILQHAYLADFTISNNGTLSDLYHQLDLVISSV